MYDDEDPKCYRNAINRPNANLWPTAIEAKINDLRRNYIYYVIDRLADRKIVVSK
jgi:hypothetical protein